MRFIDVRNTLIMIFLCTFVLCSCHVYTNKNGNNISNSSDDWVGDISVDGKDNWMDHVNELESLTCYNNKVYYLNENGIVCFDVSKQKESVLVNDCDVTSFYIENDTIYYCLKEKTIMACNLSGENSQTVVNFQEVQDYMLEDIKRFTVYHGIIYIYSSATSIIQFNPKTHECKEFVGDVSQGSFFNNCFYYIDHAEKTQAVYSKTCDGYKDEIIRRPTEINNFNDTFVFNNALFLSTQFPAKLYRFNESGSDIICNAIPDSDYLRYFPTDKYIYLQVG